MLSFVQFCIFITIISLNAGVNTLDLCSFSDEDSPLGDSYLWKNLSTKNCGCDNCIRKCCKPGYFRILGTKWCFKNATEYAFKVPVYENDVNYAKDVVDINDFVVGPIYCDYFNYPADDYYVQTDGTVWVPTFDRYFYNDQYCVDENNGLSLILCLPSESIKINVVGRYN